VFVVSLKLVTFFDLYKVSLKEVESLSVTDLQNFELHALFLFTFILYFKDHHFVVRRADALFAGNLKHKCDELLSVLLQMGGHFVSNDTSA
jgi:hypothetical protein